MERLDVFNGLLLAPHVDAAFDGGWITFEDDGATRVSPRLDGAAVVLRGLDLSAPVVELMPKHRVFAAWHRTWVFE